MIQINKEIDIIVYAKNIPNYNNKNITCKIDNEQIATVDKNGKDPTKEENVTALLADIERVLA